MLSLGRFLACSCMVLQLASAADFYLKCNAYTGSNGQQRVGAFGVCQNDCFAVNRGGKPGTLNRASGRTDDRGCTAGRGGNSPCSTGNSPYANGGTCDEYPYASTTQGGASGNPAVLRCVPGGENSSGGAQLTNFFNANNVAVGASFRVGVDYDPNNAPPFCANTRMNNDGTEFKYVNGALVNARRVRRELDLFEDATTPAWASGPPQVFKIFKTSTGSHAILFDENAKVGDPMWTDALPLPGALNEVVGGHFLQEHIGWTNGTMFA